MRQAIINMTL